MTVSVDISMYPLHKDFEIPIKNFIKKLRLSRFVTIENPLSTQVYGNYNDVMDWLKENMEEAFLNENNCVFNLKIIKGDRSSYEPSF